MKKALLAVFGLALTLSLKAQTSKTSNFGDAITPEKSISVQRLPGMIKEGDTLHVKVEGTIQSVCQKKGCWMKMDMGNGETMMVHFKDYGFFVPKDCGGKKIIMEGIAFIDVTTVDQLRHYAEDAGKSKEEIAAINEPEKELTFEANGVILYNE